MFWHGRKKPYTTIGIGRKQCVHCGAKARFQWSACANKNRYLPLCTKCDVEVNRWFLNFCRLPNAVQLLAWYKREIGYEIPESDHPGSSHRPDLHEVGGP